MKMLSKPIVLIVEDESLIRLVAIEAFSDAGFRVLEAQDSAEALEVYDARREIHIIFTDVNMPGDLNGIDLAECLLKLSPRLQIIITSALPIIRSVEHLPALFVSKPYNLGAVTASARELLAA